jgi:hypothetical protein
MLTFPDGTQAGVFGMDEALVAMYEESRLANAETAEEIVKMLATKNYIAASVRQQYRNVVIAEYERFLKTREKQKATENATQRSLPKRDGRSLFLRLFRRK